MSDVDSASRNIGRPSEARGTVVACQANFYRVQVPLAAGQTSVYFLCTRRALLKKMGQQIVVGDQVQLEELDWQSQRGAIAACYPRRNLLDRPPISNVDQILLVFALAEPALDPMQLSRFLVKAESTGIPVSLCLNKRDLLSDQQIADWKTRLNGWGYSPVVLSIQQDRQLPAALLEQLQGRISVVAGPSGVGKSSLLNRLVPHVEARTNQVSGKLGRGRHTTRHVELFELPGGGLLADTPGFNQPDVTCSVEALKDCFPEIRQGHSRCQFKDCSHRGEPGCAVGTHWERYDHYCLFLEDVLRHQETISQRPDADAAAKIKIGSDGQVQHEPKLEAKKYRRVSRRQRHQDLQDMCADLTAIDSIDDLDDAALEEYGF